jgi:hypothetical protein
MKTIIAVLMLLLGSAAHASGLDVITLADGTIFRGNVTELKPGDHVVVVLLDGRSQSIAWSDITSSVGPSFPCDPAAEYLTPAPGRVPLEVDSTVPSSIAVARGPEMIPVCATTPCTIYVSGDVALSATGDRIDPCPINVSVPPAGGRVLLHPASLAKRSSGVALLIAGATMSIAGAALAGVGTSFNHEPTYSGGKMGYEDNSAPMEAIGGTIAGVGVGALVSGIVLLATNHASSDLQPGIHF